jgi:DNA-binding transcriptional regulator YiaG
VGAGVARAATGLRQPYLPTAQQGRPIAQRFLRDRAADVALKEAFAERFGFTTSAVRDWEQKRKNPILANRILLAVIAKRPDVIEEVLAA